MRGGGLGQAPALIKISGSYLCHARPPSRRIYLRRRFI